MIMYNQQIKGHFVPLVCSQAPSGEEGSVGTLGWEGKLVNSSFIRSPRIRFILTGDDHDHLQPAEKVSLHL